MDSFDQVLELGGDRGEGLDKEVYLDDKGTDVDDNSSHGDGSLCESVHSLFSIDAVVLHAQEAGEEGKIRKMGGGGGGMNVNLNQSSLPSPAQDLQISHNQETTVVSNLKFDIVYLPFLSLDELMEEFVQLNIVSCDGLKSNEDVSRALRVFEETSRLVKSSFTAKEKLLLLEDFVPLLHIISLNIIQKSVEKYSSFGSNKIEISNLVVLYLKMMIDLLGGCNENKTLLGNKGFCTLIVAVMKCCNSNPEIVRKDDIFTYCLEVVVNMANNLRISIAPERVAPPKISQRCGSPDSPEAEYSTLDKSPPPRRYNSPEQKALGPSPVGRVANSRGASRGDLSRNRTPSPSRRTSSPTGKRDGKASSNLPSTPGSVDRPTTRPDSGGNIEGLNQRASSPDHYRSRVNSQEKIAHTDGSTITRTTQADDDANIATEASIKIFDKISEKAAMPEAPPTKEAKEFEVVRKERRFVSNKFIFFDNGVLDIISEFLTRKVCVDLIESRSIMATELFDLTEDEMGDRYEADITSPVTGAEANASKNNRNGKSKGTTSKNALYQLDYSPHSLRLHLPPILAAVRAISSLCGESATVFAVLQTNIPQLLVTLFKVGLHCRSYVVSNTMASHKVGNLMSDRHLKYDDRVFVDHAMSDIVLSLLKCFVVIFSAGNQYRSFFGSLAVKNSVSKIYTTYVVIKDSTNVGKPVDVGLSLIPMLINHFECVCYVMFHIKHVSAPSDEEKNGEDDGQEEDPYASAYIDASAALVASKQGQNQHRSTEKLTKNNSISGFIDDILTLENGTKQGASGSLEVGSHLTYLSVIFPEVHEEIQSLKEREKELDKTANNDPNASSMSGLTKRASVANNSKQASEASGKKKINENDREFVVMRRCEVEAEHLVWVLLDLVACSGYDQLHATFKAGGANSRIKPSKRAFDNRLMHNNMRLVLLFKNGILTKLLDSVKCFLDGCKSTMSALNVPMQTAIDMNNYEHQVYKKKKNNKLRLHKLPASVLNLHGNTLKLLAEIS